MKAATALLLILLLAACGGGDAVPGDRAYIGPPDCVNYPEACK